MILQVFDLTLQCIGFLFTFLALDQKVNHTLLETYIMRHISKNNAYQMSVSLSDFYFSRIIAILGGGFREGDMLS